MPVVCTRPWRVRQGGCFIGPESDHCLVLTLTDWLTDSLISLRLDWCDSPNSKLLDVVCVADVEHILVEILRLKFGWDFKAEVWSWSCTPWGDRFRDLRFWTTSLLGHLLFYLKTFLFKTEKNCPHHLSLVKSYDPLIRSVPGWIAKLERNFDVGLAGLDKFGNRILNFLLPWGSRYIWWKYMKIKNTWLYMCRIFSFKPSF